MIVKGDCFGVRLERRSDKDSHVQVVLMVEDDETWHDTDSFDSAWLPELIRVLKSAQEIMHEECEKDPKRRGYQCKEE